jgi:hypothetical protein
MNTRDLIELSQLDALGLLDEQERDEFDAAFAAASPAIQAQLRREQSRLVKTDWVACDAEPPEGLRESVLGEMSLALRVADLRPRVLAAIHSEIARRPVPQGAGALFHGPGREFPRIYPVRRVSRLWRAATLGFAAAAVAFGGTTLYLKGQYDEQERMARANAMIGDFVSVPGLGLREILFDRATSHRFFESNDASIKAQAALFISPEKSSACLVVRNLPDLTSKGKNYRLVALTDDGLPGQELAKFTSNGGLKAQEVDIGQHRRVAIVEADFGQTASEGRVLLTSEVLA